MCTQLPVQNYRAIRLSGYPAIRLSGCPAISGYYPWLSGHVKRYVKKPITLYYLSPDHTLKACEITPSHHNKFANAAGRLGRSCPFRRSHHEAPDVLSARHDGAAARRCIHGCAARLRARPPMQHCCLHRCEWHRGLSNTVGNATAMECAPPSVLRRAHRH